MGQPIYCSILLTVGQEDEGLFPHKYLDSLELHLSQFPSEWKSAHCASVSRLFSYFRCFNVEDGIPIFYFIASRCSSALLT